jgi:hypothetical protein
MKIKDLREECTKRKIAFDKKAKKAELIHLLSLFEKEEASEEIAPPPSKKYFPTEDSFQLKKGTSVKEGNEITYAEFCEEIQKKEFIEEFAASLKKLLVYKLAFYNKKIQEITKERERIKRKIDIIMQQKGVSPSIIKERYPFYDFYCCLVADIELLGKDMYQKMTDIKEEDVKASLLDIATNKEKGLASLVGRDNIKDILCSYLYSFSKSHLIFTNSFTNFALIGNSGIGKCLGKDTPVLLFNGDICLVQDISIGMKLMGDDSLPREVLSVTYGRERLYRIRQKTAEDYVVNASHILTLMTKDFDIVDIPILQLLAIEGWQDRYVGFSTSVVFPCSRRYFCKRSYSQKYCRFLFEKGKKYGREASTRPIPKKYKIIPYRLFFLEGILSFFQKTEEGNYLLPYIISSTYPPEWIKDVMYIARSVGFHAYMDSHKNIVIHSGDMCIPHDNGFYALRKIEIEDMGIGEYFGFEIDGNRRFLLGDFTVTHNTHIAKVISHVYSTCGILSTGDVKIVSRYDLIGSYVGQTTPKTQSLLFQTLEGVLFIDEAYQLASEKGDNDYGSEAITEIVNFTDKYMGMSIVIVAGYKDLMFQRFFKSNEGLMRRFPMMILLNDYTTEELCDILLGMLEKKRVFIPHSLKNYVFTLLHTIRSSEPSIFSHQAGDMVNLASSIEKSILSSYRVKWINGDLENNRFIIKEGFSRFLENKHFYLS